MKKTAIVTGGSKNQFPAMAILALNIADKCPNVADELVIFHSVGQLKFWNGLYNEKLNNYYCEWVDNYTGMVFVQNKQKKSIIKKSSNIFCLIGIVRLIQKIKQKKYVKFLFCITHLLFN